MDKNGTRANGNPNWSWVGLKNYIVLFTDDEEFYVSLFNNIRWLLFSLVAIPIGLLLALFVNQRILGMRYIKSLFYFPFVINAVVIGVIFTWFYNPKYGALTYVLSLFGLDPIPVLADEDLATYGIIIASFFPGIAYTMILYITGLTGVNREMVEAGRIDGAAGFTMLWHVILPQLKPATLIAIVVTIVGSLRSFDLIAVMTAGGPWGSSEVLAYKMYQESLFNYRMGYGAAIATILFLIMDIYIAWFLYRLFKNEKSEK
jgi:multiple sugar transport system permease protein